MIFKCANPECGKPLKLNRPPKSGVYPVTCPHCGVKKNFKLKGLDAFATQQVAAPAASSAETPPAPEINRPNFDEPLNNSAKPPIQLKDDFIVDQLYSFPCPHCGQEGLGLQTSKAGHKRFPCPVCLGIIEADVRPKTEVLENPVTTQLLKGKLVLLRRGWLNKNYPLTEGSHTVGRFDESEMSDISIKGDPGMSRRSIRIDVSNRDKTGTIFKLTVLKSTNPVLLNGKPLAKGESVSLNFGDTIVLGKTKFRFDKDQ